MSVMPELHGQHQEARELLKVDEMEYDLQCLREENANLRARLAQAEAGTPIKADIAERHHDFYSEDPGYLSFLDSLEQVRRERER